VFSLAKTKQLDHYQYETLPPVVEQVLVSQVSDPQMVGFALEKSYLLMNRVVFVVFVERNAAELWPHEVRMSHQAVVFAAAVQKKQNLKKMKDQQIPSCMGCTQSDRSVPPQSIPRHMGYGLPERDERG